MPRPSSDRWFWLAALGGAATFAIALFFQYAMGLPPCQMCVWQRYALGVGIGGAVLGALAAPVLGLIGVIGFVAEAGIAGFHSGVERGWWAGPQSCSGGSLATDFDAGALAQALKDGPPPACNEIPWELLGLSIANWNMLAALGLAAICFMGLRRPRRAAQPG